MSLPVDRLVSVCNLLDSPVPGERDAAALAACRMVKSAGLTWEQVINPTPVRPANNAYSHTYEYTYDDDDFEQPQGWSSRASACIRAVTRHRLTKWERDFLFQIRDYLHQPSARQLEILDKIERKLGI